MNNPFKTLLLPLILINLMGHMALSGGRLSGSLFILKDGHPEAIVGLFMALFSILPVLTGLSIGRWLDRVGPAKIMRVGIVLVMIGICLPLFVMSVPILLLTAALVGAGFNMVGMAAQLTVGHLPVGDTPGARLANFGWYAVGHSISSAAGPLISGVMIDAFGFKAAFGSMACFTLVALWLIFARAAWLSKLVPTASQVQMVSPPKTSGKFSNDLLNDQTLRKVYWTNVVTAASWDFFIMIVPVLGVRMGLSAAVIGSIMSMFALGTFAARLSMPWLSKRVGEWQILACALAIVVLVFLMMPFAKAAVLMMLAGFVIGAALGTSQPNILSLLHTLSPAGRGGEAVGLRSLITNAVSVVTPIGFGVALSLTGVVWLLWASAGLVALGNIPASRLALEQRALKQKEQ